MLVTSKIPCGNGNILWFTPDHFEVEVIAYSKSPRYTYFKVSGITTPHTRTITLRPDSRFPGNFGGLHAKIWMKQGEDGPWEALPQSDVCIEPQAIRFTVSLKPDVEYYFSTEPGTDYAKTTQELFSIARRLGTSASLHNIGYSIEHRPIIALRMTASPEEHTPGLESRPVILITAGEHATEFSGEALVRGMLEYISQDSEESAKLREEFIFDFILNTNPDGNYHGWHQYNAKDWAAHNYAELVDRSWHHEFEDYMSQNGASTASQSEASPETRALGDWIKKTCPTFFVSAHSWLGHSGNPGAFYTEPSVLPPGMREIVPALNQDAIEASVEFDLEFKTYSSKNLCGGHLGAFLMKNDLAIAYTIEGHMNPGHPTLQALGKEMLKRWLANPVLNLRSSRKANWDAWHSSVSSNN